MHVWVHETRTMPCRHLTPSISHTKRGGTCVWFTLWARYHFLLIRVHIFSAGYLTSQVIEGLFQRLGISTKIDYAPPPPPSDDLDEAARVNGCGGYPRASETRGLCQLCVQGVQHKVYMGLNMPLITKVWFIVQNARIQQTWAPQMLGDWAYRERFENFERANCVRYHGSNREQILFLIEQ